MSRIQYKDWMPVVQITKELRHSELKNYPSPWNIDRDWRKKLDAWFSKITSDVLYEL